MTTHAAGLDAILSKLSAKRDELMKTAAAKTAERGTTTHPVDKADNNTGSASTGARASENTSDSKAQNALNPDTAGSPDGIRAPAGSQGVDAKDATQAPADKPDTSGKSEMGSKDTSHPTKSARSILQDRIKAASNGCGKEGDLPKQELKIEETEADKKKKEEAKETPAQETAEHKEAADKEAAEKFAAYCEDLVKTCPDDFAAGCKFAMDVLASVVQAAQAKHAAAGMDPAAMAGGAAPAEGDGMAAGGATPGAGAGQPGGDELEQLAAELEAAGVTPEQLAQALQAEEGGQASPGDDQQVQALQEAMQAEGMSPEELAGAVGGEGGAPAGGEAAGGAPVAEEAAAAKAAADKEAHAKLVGELRAQIRTIKAAKAQAKK